MRVRVLNYFFFLFFKIAIFETGCGYLETEFGNLIKSRSIVIEPTKIFDCLDEEYGNFFLF